MEDFIGLIIIALLYLLSASSNKKKKEKRRQRKAALEQIERAYAKEAKPAERKPERKSSERAVPRQDMQRAAYSAEPAEGTRSRSECERDRLHLHQVTQAQMEAAAEGEDPCHKGGANRAEAKRTEQEQAVQPEHQLEAADAAQDILRGVIMSEILTRPSQRRAIQRSRWRA